MISEKMQFRLFVVFLGGMLTWVGLTHRQSIGELIADTLGAEQIVADTFTPRELVPPAQVAPATSEKKVLTTTLVKPETNTVVKNERSLTGETYIAVKRRPDPQKIVDQLAKRQRRPFPPGYQPPRLRGKTA